MESPDKINSLERQTKPLLSAVNELNQAVYGSTNSYGQNSSQYGTTPYNQDYGQKPVSPIYKTPSFGASSSFQPSGTSTPSHYATLNAPSKIYGTTTNVSAKPFNGASSPPPPPPPPTYLQSDYKPSPPSFQSDTYAKIEQPKPPGGYDSRTSTLGSETTSHSFKPVSFTSRFEKVGIDQPKQTTSDTTIHTFKPLTSSFDKGGSDGYTSSEYSTNTYKTPEGYRTDTYKYEYYKSEPKTTYSSSTEKYYTTTSGKDVDKGTNILRPPALGLSGPKSAFESFKNGGDGGESQYQSSYSSNVEYITEPPVIKDDSIEQKTVKKSTNEQVFEKKTSTTSRTTKQESQMKTFRFQ